MICIQPQDVCIELYNTFMARPIRNTPILYDEDAKRFLADISQLPPIEERRRERARIDKSVNDFFQMIAKFKCK